MIPLTYKGQEIGEVLSIKGDGTVEMKVYPEYLYLINSETTMSYSIGESMDLVVQ